MRTIGWLAGVAVLLLSATPARAEIMGLLELPDGFASGASNVQGWAYTTTPGAKLIQPFPVLIDGVEQFKVPCCGDRGDVQAAHPEAPLLTGFSGVYNWGLIATAVEDGMLVRPQGGVVAPSIVVQVVVADDQGGLKILSKTVDLYHPSIWPRSKLATWKEAAVPVGTAGPAFTPGPPLDATCELSNTAFYTPGAAELFCTNLVFTSPADDMVTCPGLVFSWDRGSQSFRLTSDCFVPIPP